jgi:protein subunit release factor A
VRLGGDACSNVYQMGILSELHGYVSSVQCGHASVIDCAFIVDLISETAGDTAGIKSATFLVRGQYAYGYAQYETGVHRLVRTSPYDPKGARHTSFASVRVSPHIDVQDVQGMSIKLHDIDLKITTMRSQGPGAIHASHDAQNLS